MARMTLADVSIGMRGHVTQVHDGGLTCQRIMEMGLVPGTSFTLIGTAPLGDPLELEIRGYRLSLRRSEARHVDVQLDV